VGDLLADIETDKSTVGFETVDDGFIASLVSKEGAMTQVGSPCVVIVSDKSLIPAFANVTAE
jgi:pyruvate/2-oxoglutarate dehydrogenase complex dihydrolipoamide acyltransferase (E2) component